MGRLRRFWYWMRRQLSRCPRSHQTPHRQRSSEDFHLVTHFERETNTVLEQSRIVPQGIQVQCTHVKSKCWLVCPHEFCGRLYSCAKCHDRSVPGHAMNTREVSNIVCQNCESKQVPSIMCQGQHCDTVFSEYYCQVCNVFDGLEPDYFHCAKCDKCCTESANRFHCHGCEACVLFSEIPSHSCFYMGENIDCCSICLEEMDDSRKILECGHALHESCLQGLLNSGCQNRCPLCQRTIFQTSTH